MLFDRSGSMAGNDPSEQSLAAGRAFAARLGANDRAQIAEFSGSGSSADNVRFLTPAFTNDAAQLSAAIGRVRPADGGTPLWDAMLQSVNRFTGGTQPRALLTFSDGDDTGSRSTPAAVRQAAISAGVAIYAINLRNDNTGPIDDLAHATGGAVFSTDEAQQLVRYYQVLGLLLSRQAVSCSLDIEVSIEPAAGVGEIGYGPAITVRPSLEFAVESNGRTSTTTWEPRLPLYPGRKTGISTTGRSVFETDVAERSDWITCVQAPAGSLRNSCTSAISVAACNANGNCVSEIVDGGQTIASPPSTYKYVACPWQPPLNRYHPVEVFGTFPDQTYQRWRTSESQFQCVNADRF
ncbi:MAG: VWA domain-containing protein [Lautropia sp.]